MCQHRAYDDAELSYCSECGNLICPDCGSRRVCNDCADAQSAADDAREERALAEWRYQKSTGTAGRP
jgi:hypothetical protein